MFFPGELCWQNTWRHWLDYSEFGCWTLCTSMPNTCTNILLVVGADSGYCHHIYVISPHKESLQRNQRVTLAQSPAADFHDHISTRSGMKICIIKKKKLTQGSQAFNWSNSQWLFCLRTPPIISTKFVHTA